jgi:hypothetical protein
MVTGEGGGVPDLDAIPLPAEEMEGGGDGLQAGEMVGTVHAEFIGMDAFWLGFQAAHQIPGHLLSLRTLLQHVERPEARPASDAIYRICERTPSLHFLIRPGSAWMADAVTVGMYAFPMVIGVRAELAGRRTEARRAREEAQRKGGGLADAPPLPDEGAGGGDA